MACKNILSQLPPTGHRRTVIREENADTCLWHLPPAGHGRSDVYNFMMATDPFGTYPQRGMVAADDA